MIQKIIGLLGGTFDPVHRGHLSLADIVMHRLHLDAIYFMPCKIPPLKAQAQASPSQRLDMLKLALKTHSTFHIDPRELEREGASYTLDSLIAWKKEKPETTICLILGEDAFASLPNWHRWQELLNYCHIIRINRRPIQKIEDPAFLQMIAESEILDPKWLNNKDHGYILSLEIPPLSQSSTAIRQACAQDHDIKAALNIDVANYIIENKLYRQ